MTIQRNDAHTLGRHYVIEHDGQMQQFPSVTTILTAIAKQDYLVPWAVKMALGRALAYVETNVGVGGVVTEAALAALVKEANTKGAQENQRILTAAGEFGNVAHALIEDYVGSGLRATDEEIETKLRRYMTDLAAQAETLNVPKLAPAGVAAKIRAVLEQFYRWYSEMGFHLVAGELTVYSPTHEYAGTLDYLGTRGKRGGQDLTMLDYKCLLPEQTLALADGSMVRADQVLPGDELIAWQGERFVTDRVKEVFPGGIQPCVEVRTRLGRRLRVSANHPVLIEGSWIEAGSLQPGMALTTWTALGADQSGLTEAQARLLGYLVGDGGLSEPTRRMFTNQDPAVMADFISICQSLGFTVQEQAGMPHNYRIGGIGSFLREHELYCKRSPEKHVPPAVMRGGHAVIQAFLTAYFDCDGHVSAMTDSGTPHGRPDVCFTTTSPRLAAETQDLLGRLGVQARVWCHEGKTQKQGRYRATAKPWWVKTSSRENAAKMAALLGGCRVARKRERLQIWAEAIQERSGMPRDRRDDAVAAVSALPEQPTIAIEMERTKTFVTSGIVTHNTSNYYSTDYALQTVAYKYAYQEIHGHEIGDIYVVRIGKKDAGLQVVHLPAASHAALFEIFLTVRRLWQWKHSYTHGVIRRHAPAAAATKPKAAPAAASKLTAAQQARIIANPAV